MSVRAGLVLEKGIRGILGGPKAAGIRYTLVLVCLVGASLVVFAAAGPHAVGGGTPSTGATEAQVSGFTVTVIRARATGFRVEVEVEVSGRPEIGDVAFTPAPVRVSGGR